MMARPRVSGLCARQRCVSLEDGSAARVFVDGNAFARSTSQVYVGGGGLRAAGAGDLNSARRRRGFRDPNTSNFNTLEYTKRCLKHPEQPKFNTQHSCKRVLYLLP